MLKELIEMSVKDSIHEGYVPRFSFETTVYLTLIHVYLLIFSVFCLFSSIFFSVIKVKVTLLVPLVIFLLFSIVMRYILYKVKPKKKNG